MANVFIVKYLRLQTPPVSLFFLCLLTFGASCCTVHPRVSVVKLSPLYSTVVILEFWCGGRERVGGDKSSIIFCLTLDLCLRGVAFTSFIPPLGMEIFVFVLNRLCLLLFSLSATVPIHFFETQSTVNYGFGVCFFLCLFVFIAPFTPAIHMPTLRWDRKDSMGWGGEIFSSRRWVSFQYCPLVKRFSWRVGRRFWESFLMATFQSHLSRPWENLTGILTIKKMVQFLEWKPKKVWRPPLTAAPELSYFHSSPYSSFNN